MAVVAAFVAAVLSPVFALPAEACSCAAPGDLNEWVDQSEAVFVGTMIEKHDVGASDVWGPESIYVFEVEEWVKGDLGDVIEVRSASDGAGCGFEFWDEDMRTGAAIYLQDGELRGDLCSQVDADVLLAAMAGPTPSATGVGHLIAALGWDSTRLVVLDEAGNHVIDLDPPGDVPAWSGTQMLEMCPGGNRMIQVAQPHIFVWDTSNFEVAAEYEVEALVEGWPSDIVCGDPDASSIRVLISGELESELIEVVPEETTVITFTGVNGSIGDDFVVAQKDHEGDVILVDIETGEQVDLTESPDNLLVGTAIAVHPSQPLVAVLENWYFEDAPTAATLNVFDRSGATVGSFDIPGEAYDPRWIDDHRVSVYAHDTVNWETTSGFAVDTDNGEIVETSGWNAFHTIAEGNTIYGVDGGTIVTAAIGADSMESLVTLPTQAAGPLILLETAPTIDTTTTSTTEPESTATTTPPLIAVGEGPPSDTDYTRWIAGGAIVTFLGILGWLALRKPSQDPDPS